MVYKIDPNNCIGCHTCMAVGCPKQAISIGPDGKCVIDTKLCASCGMCASMCPVSAIVLDNK